MTLERFLRTIVTALTQAGVPSMLTGSVAAAYRGAIRSTMDVDLVIDPTPATLQRFIEVVEAAGFYVSDEAAREALASRGVFNVIDPETGWKADLIIRKARSFSETEFARREPVEFLGIPIAVARAEDLIVAKLEWAALGASARQVEDVRTLLRLCAPELDLEYIERWVVPLGLRGLWEEVRRDNYFP